MRRLLVVPAAGTGSRLGSEMPKAAAPVAGRPMIRRIVNLYASTVDGVLVVVRPADESTIRRAVGRTSVPVRYRHQERPTGMLAALKIAARAVAGERVANVWITWCDQVAVRPDTVRRIQRVSEAESNAALVIPTVRRREPYVHFVRDEQGAIVDVLHRREGDELPEVGESDIGLFVMSGRTFTVDLPRYAQAPQRGELTGEANFLPIVPWLSERATVRTIAASHPIESVGVNTPADRKEVERFLEERGVDGDAAYRPGDASTVRSGREDMSSASQQGGGAGKP